MVRSFFFLNLGDFGMVGRFTVVHSVHQEVSARRLPGSLDQRLVARVCINCPGHDSPGGASNDGRG